VETSVNACRLLFVSASEYDSVFHNYLLLYRAVHRWSQWRRCLTLVAAELVTGGRPAQLHRPAAFTASGRLPSTRDLRGCKPSEIWSGGLRLSVSRTPDSIVKSSLAWCMKPSIKMHYFIVFCVWFTRLLFVTVWPYNQFSRTAVFAAYWCVTFLLWKINKTTKEVGN